MFKNKVQTDYCFTPSSRLCYLNNKLVDTPPQSSPLGAEEQFRIASFDVATAIAKATTKTSAEKIQENKSLTVSQTQKDDCK